MTAENYMRLALLEGRKALPNCLPNPPVGCVLVRNNSVIASGFTNPPGKLHAEAMAISQVIGDLSEVTAFVTLEPCSFYGRTPSCAKTLVECKIKKVFVAILDPDPRNSGKGIEILRTAGIEIDLGILADEATTDLSPYLNLSANNPMVGTANDDPH
jgi:pyrimidine deaminase RibD-like protein